MFSVISYSASMSISNNWLDVDTHILVGAWVYSTTSDTDSWNIRLGKIKAFNNVLIGFLFCLLGFFPQKRVFYFSDMLVPDFK